MIPKVAHFYWTGGPLPWLREQALQSFVQLHPGWEVQLASPEQRTVPPGVQLVLDTITDPRLAPAARSDVWRYHALAVRGGLYADTDIVFLRNVEPLFREDKDAWITTDLGTHVPHFGWLNTSHGRRVSSVSISIGVLGARPASLFFTRAWEHARRVDPSGDYQSHGTTMLAAKWEEIARGVAVGVIPSEAFYREGSSRPLVRQLWATDGPLDANEYGLHWYGGSPESERYLGVKSIEQLPKCLVRTALEQTRLVDPTVRG